MNKNLVCFVALLLASSQQPFIITAHDISSSQDTHIIEQKNTTLESDELDMVYEQYEQQEEAMQHIASSPQIPDWVVSFAIAVLLKYVAFKEFMETSWDSLKEKLNTFKEKIVRKKKIDALKNYAKNR